MSLLDWAEKEIEIACKRENPDRKEGEWDYGCACYESALKAFKSLLEDGHSEYSIQMTKHILNRLIDGKPLTPIEDTDDIWNAMHRDRDYKSYHCKRMSSLFKDVYPDGTITYSDVNRIIGVDVNDPDNTYYSGLVRRVIEEMYPITMPYMPENKPFRVYCEEILTDRNNGDFDTVAIFYVVKPDGEKVEINRYFKEGSAEGQAWTEIDHDEYMKRCEMAAELLEGVEKE